MYIQIGGTVWTAALEDDPSVTAWKELLSKGPLTVDMSDYGGFEKVGGIGTTLPQSNRQITTKPGDIILYQGNSVAIYYDENTWSFTRLGHIDGVTESQLREVLKAGGGNVSATFSLDDPARNSKVRAFDLEARTVTLNSGYEMPLNGLGTYSLHGETCVNSVKSALRSGVRLIDTASAYGNEKEVGQAIREAVEELGISREEIFVTTKIYPGSEMADPEQAIQACLDRLDIGYVDMVLLHHPDKNDVKAYKAMEKFVEEGKIRSIGLSNWYVEELEKFLPQVSITPALVQNEIHPYYQENEVIPYIQNLGIVVQGWYPLGGRGHTSELLGDEVISSIARAHGVSSAQVILRWNLQEGVVVIPGSSNPDHIKENTLLYHFLLTDEEMARIDALDRGEKHDWY
ncbi:MAG: aldo/keto reductase [Oscillospiraceae bacterium]|nr:aldo/keto reductase [Oscillospiraceae bacterium]